MTLWVSAVSIIIGGTVKVKTNKGVICPYHWKEFCWKDSSPCGQNVKNSKREKTILKSWFEFDSKLLSLVSLSLGLYCCEEISWHGNTCQQFQGFSPLWSWRGAWWNVGRHGAGVESATSCRQQEVNLTIKLREAWARDLKAHPHSNIFLQQGHTS